MIFPSTASPTTLTFLTDGGAAIRKKKSLTKKRVSLKGVSNYHSQLQGKMQKVL